MTLPLLLTAWPFVVWLLPVSVLVSAVVFLAKGNRRAVAQLMVLLACFVIGALLMEFFVFMAARMARSGSAQAQPVWGTGTLTMLQTIAHPRAVSAPPLSWAALAAYSVPLSYLWLVVVWTLHLRGQGKSTRLVRARAKPARKSPRKAAA